jgi:hypothetical protein
MGRKIIISLTIGVFLLCAPAIERRIMQTVLPSKALYSEVDEADSVKISWDPPPDVNDTAAYYELFYRPVSDSSLILYKSNIGLINPKAVIYRKDILSKDSVFYFAVRYVTGDGLKSDFHFSSDSTAQPVGGWYLFWKVKEGLKKSK